jgi:hypothetical protein
MVDKNKKARRRQSGRKGLEFATDIMRIPAYYRRNFVFEAKR